MLDPLTKKVISLTLYSTALRVTVLRQMKAHLLLVRYKYLAGPLPVLIPLSFHRSDPCPVCEWPLAVCDITIPRQFDLHYIQLILLVLVCIRAAVNGHCRSIKALSYWVLNASYDGEIWWTGQRQKARCNMSPLGKVVTGGQLLSIGSSSDSKGHGWKQRSCAVKEVQWKGANEQKYCTNQLLT